MTDERKKTFIIIMPADYYVMGFEELPEVINALCRLFTHRDIKITSSYPGENAYCRRRTLNVRIVPYHDGTRVRQNLTIFNNDGTVCLHSPVGVDGMIVSRDFPGTFVKIDRVREETHFSYHHGEDSDGNDIVRSRSFIRVR